MTGARLETCGTCGQLVPASITDSARKAGLETGICTDCFWEKHGAVVKMFWLRDGREYVETLRAVTPGELYWLRESQGQADDKGVLVYVRVEVPGSF